MSSLKFNFNHEADLLGECFGLDKSSERSILGAYEKALEECCSTSGAVALIKHLSDAELAFVFTRLFIEHYDLRPYRNPNEKVH